MLTSTASADSPPAVLVVGSLNRDYVCRVSAIPQPGQTVLGGELSLGCGGKGSNQAVAAARMGVPTALVGCVGADSDGRALVEELAASGVDTDRVITIDGVRTGAALVIVADDGENSIVVSPGANGRLDGDLARSAAGQRLRAGDVLVVQAEIPPAAIIAAAEAAARVAARVVLNLAPYCELPTAVLEACDPLVVNEGEARALLAVAAGARADARDMAAELTRRVRSVVITVGAAGAIVAQGPDLEHIPADEVEVVDSTGAGDAFTGALAAGLCRGEDLRSAARLGVAAGSYAVRGHGAQSSFPTLGDLTEP